MDRQTFKFKPWLSTKEGLLFYFLVKYYLDGNKRTTLSIQMKEIGEMFQAFLIKKNGTNICMWERQNWSGLLVT